MITVNLFDQNFAHTNCSVAYATPKYVEYVRGKMEWDGITLFTDAWIVDPIVDQVKSKYKIAWLHEPGCLWSSLYEQAPLYKDKFDLVLTYSRDLIKKHGFKYTPYGGIWIPEQERKVHKKDKLVSMLYGAKHKTDGHILRHEIGDHYEGIDYFGYKGQKTDYSQQTKINVLKPYMFSIVVETCKEDWLFTEILLDCLAVGTVPIFWGCPDIDKFFDPRGIIAFDTSDDIEEILELLSPKLYLNMINAVYNNNRALAEYAITEDWMFTNIYKELL